MSLSAGRLVPGPLTTPNDLARTVVAVDRRSAALPAGAVLRATAIAYVLSRTTGLPGVLPEPEPVDGLGVLTTTGELVGVVACLVLTFRKEQP
jgi:hypothetical protein